MTEYAEGHSGEQPITSYELVDGHIPRLTSAGIKGDCELVTIDVSLGRVYMSAKLLVLTLETTIEC